MFTPDYELPELRSTERNAALRELLGCLIQADYLPSFAEESLFAALCWREEVMTTGIGFGIAVPHVTTEFVTRRIVAVGKWSAGIDFSSLDGQPVNTVCLIVFPKGGEALEEP